MSTIQHQPALRFITRDPHQYDLHVELVWTSLATLQRCLSPKAPSQTPPSYLTWFLHVGVANCRGQRSMFDCFFDCPQEYLLLSWGKMAFYSLSQPLSSRPRAGTENKLSIQYKLEWLQMKDCGSSSYNAPPGECCVETRLLWSWQICAGRA